MRMTSSINADAKAKAYNAFKKVPGMSDTDAQEVASLFELKTHDDNPTDDKTRFISMENRVLKWMVGLIMTSTISICAVLITFGTFLQSDIADVKSDLKQGIADVKSDLKQDIADVKSDLKQDIADVKSDLKDVKSDLKQDIADVKSDLKK